jgi:hypothetical protein
VSGIGGPGEAMDGAADRRASEPGRMPGENERTCYSYASDNIRRMGDL